MGLKARRGILESHGFIAEGTDGVRSISLGAVKAAGRVVGPRGMAKYDSLAVTGATATTEESPMATRQRAAAAARVADRQFLAELGPDGVPNDVSSLLDEPPSRGAGREGDPDGRPPQDVDTDSLLVGSAA
jgi:hypothetical protein